MDQPQFPPGYAPVGPALPRPETCGFFGGDVHPSNCPCLSQLAVVQPQPVQQAVPQQLAMIPGISVVTSTDGSVPQFLVIAREKEGKSATVGTTLVNWPRGGMHPLFFAFDESGPNSCLKLGYTPHVMQIKKLAGMRTIDKARDGLTRLENSLPRVQAMYGSIIVDCGSTMVDLFHEDARKGKNPNPQSHFGDALMWSREVQHRLVGLGLPIWWLAWLREPEVVEERIGNDVKEVKVKKLIPGGANILGSFRNMLAGKVQHIFILEKQNIGAHPAADEAGFVRVFHTRDHMNIRAGGRFSHLLPPVMPARCDSVMNLVMPPR